MLFGFLFRCCQTHASLVTFCSSDVFFVFCGDVFPCHLMHSCQKQGHSCFRNIVSFASMPGRASMRAVARALVYLTLQVFHGYAVQNLSTAAADVVSAIRNLRPRDRSGCCRKCGARMPGPTLRVYDAGQAYEVIPMSAFLEALADLRESVLA